MNNSRLSDNPILAENQKQSSAMVDRQTRNFQIIDILEKGGLMTAKEIAVEMLKRGLVPLSERNFVSPRIKELRDKGIIELVQKKTCQYTGRPVGVFKLKEREEN